MSTTTTTTTTTGLMTEAEIPARLAGLVGLTVQRPVPWRRAARVGRESWQGSEPLHHHRLSLKRMARAPRHLPAAASSLAFH